MSSDVHQNPVVRVAAGAVREHTDGGVQRFIGIPYAAPPFGDRRFAPPAPLAPWAGIRDVTAPGANAPQRIKAVPGLDVEALIGSGRIAGDDYLTRNVWRPDDDTAGAPVQDCATFARDGVVCVAINYRLGIDRFLPIPGLPTNFGLRDIVAALEWVQAEIARFGGDPANVTVVGEPAGAMAIADLATSPLASGLFGRAIV